MDNHRLDACREMAIQSRTMLLQSRATATSARELLAGAKERIRWSIPTDADESPSSPMAVEREREREEVAAKRLLEWEAADLTEIVPGEMGTLRRRFAVALYEVVSLSESLGMADERLHYHLGYALDQYRASTREEGA